MRVRAWRTSGLTARRFATREKISLPGLRRWAREFPKSEPQEDDHTLVPFVELVPTAIGSVSVEVACPTGHVVRINVGSDMSVVAELLGAVLRA